MLAARTPYRLILSGRVTLACETLDEAITAAARPDLDSATATIEKDTINLPVRDWIIVRTAGGTVTAG
jgi:hypothetical protein